MASPRSSSIAEGSPKPTMSSGGSLPATPAKLAELDPAIILSVKSRNTLTAPKSPDFAGHKRNTSSSSVVTVTKYNSAEAGRPKPAHLERNWRNMNDPFVASPERTSTSFTAMGAQHPKADGEKQEDESTVGSPTPKPREDRDNTKISAENAQGFFTANSCIFVANLAVGKNDDDLEIGVSKAFSRFGDLWVKIRRDRNAMPYAFCQFTKESDASRALNGGQGLEICGRPCRVERAKANRSVYLSRIAGGKISNEEAHYILKDCGPIEKVWFPTDTDKEIYRLSDGIWATFIFFQDARDSLTKFKDNREFRLEVPFSPEEHDRKRHASIKFSPAAATPHRGVRPSNNWGSNGSRPTNNSIFIGNLPMGVSIESIRESLAGCGTIRQIEITGRATNTTAGFNRWAYVEFANDGGVKAALASDIRINGDGVRVERRESHDGPRRSFSVATSSPRNRAPLTPRTPANSNNASTRTATTTPRTMTPIYEGSQQAQAQPQTPVNPHMYGPGAGYGTPYNHYTSYYSPSQLDAGAGNVTSYVPLTGQQPMMGQYSAIPGFVPTQYSPGPYSYQYYVSPPVANNPAAVPTYNPASSPTPAPSSENANADNGVAQ